MLTTIATVAVLGFFASRLIRGLLVARRGPGRATIRAVLRRIRMRHVWPVPLVLGAVVGVAMALSIGGAYFMWVYLRRYGRTRNSDDATLESTTAHTVYNGVIIVVVLISFISLALGA